MATHPVPATGATDHLQIDRDGIARAFEMIRPLIRRTPTIAIDGADCGLGSGSVLLKLELLQHGGSFKARGAFANMRLRPVPAAGVAAASGGNHGVAVAYAARRLERPARIFVPSVASPTKIQRIRAYGADLVVTGERYTDALAECQAWAERSGALHIHAYDQLETLLGQGTVALELDEQAGQLDTLLVAVGGGGLLGGIASWYAGRIRLVGVEPDQAPTLTAALAAGRPVDAPAGGDRGRLAGPEARGGVDVSDCATPCRPRRAGLGRRYSSRAASAVGWPAHRRRAWWCRGFRGPPLGPLSTGLGRARRSASLWRQHHRHLCRVALMAGAMDPRTSHSAWQVLADVAARSQRYLDDIGERRVAPSRDALAGLRAFDVPLAGGLDLC